MYKLSVEFHSENGNKSSSLVDDGAEIIQNNLRKYLPNTAHAKKLSQHEINSDAQKQKFSSIHLIISVFRKSKITRTAEAFFLMKISRTFCNNTKKCSICYRNCAKNPAFHCLVTDSLSNSGSVNSQWSWKLDSDAMVQADHVLTMKTTTTVTPFQFAHITSLLTPLLQLPASMEVLL